MAFQTQDHKYWLQKITRLPEASGLFFYCAIQAYKASAIQLGPLTSKHST